MVQADEWTLKQVQGDDCKDSKAANLPATATFTRFTPNLRQRMLQQGR